MNNSFMIAAQCVAPVLLLILVGMLLRRIKWLEEPGVNALDKLSFKLLLPLALFRNIYNSDFKTAFNGRLVIISIVLVILSFGLAIVLASFKEKDPPRRASLAQSIFRNNCLLFGLPMMNAMYGDAEVGMFSLLLAFVIPINNLLAVALISMLTSKKITVLELLRRLITNPYVDFAAAALVIKLTGIALPQPVVKVVGDISAASTPMALISLGAGLRLASLKQDAGTVLYGTFSRLIIGPLLFIPLLALLGITGAPMTAMFFLIGTPCAVASYIMAKQMGADGDLAGHLVVIQSLASILSIFLFLLLLGVLGWT